MRLGRFFFSLSFLFLAALLLGASPAVAQMAGLTGTVTDESGAVVPGAQVTATNEATGLSRTMTTASDGVYIFTQLPPGKYKLEIKAQGFKTAVREHVEAEVGITRTLDIRLTVGAVTEVVQVVEQASALNTTDATIGNVVSGREIQNLPLLNLDPAGLLSLQPGVTFIPGAPDIVGGYGGTSNFDGRAGSVNGSRSDQSNVTLDGIDVNDPQNGYAFQSVLRTTQASLQEFRVTTSNANADAGRSSAAQVQLVTKSGSNTVHGTAYWAHRNEVLNANDFFLNRDGVERGKFRRHIYGFALGGPVVKDRFFLFGNWEELRELLSSTTTRDVPSMNFRDGVLIYPCTTDTSGSFPNPPCPTTATTVTGVSGATYTVPAGSYGLSPAQLAALDPLGIGASTAVLQYLQSFPVPNSPGSFDRQNLVGYSFNAPVDNFFRTWILRADWHIDRKKNHTLFWRGTMHDDDFTFSPPQFPGQPPNQTTVSNNKGYAISYTAIFGANWVNNFRYGLTRIGEQTAGQQTGSFIDFRFIDNPADYDSNSFGRIIPQHHFRNDTTWNFGQHTISFGGEMRFTRNTKFSNANSFHIFVQNASWLDDGGRSMQPGQPTCNRPACDTVPLSAGGRAYRDLVVNLLGVITQVSAYYNFDRNGNTLPAGEPVRRKFAVNEYELYIQDQWRIFPSLTLTGGLRYLMISPPWEANGNQVSPTPSLSSWFEARRQHMLAGRPTTAAGRITIDLSGPVNNGPHYYDWDFNNLSPRVALAWSPHFREGLLNKIFGDGKTAFRLGYSLVYDRVGMALATSFDEIGSFGLSTNIDSAFGGCNIGPTATDPACVRFSGVTNTAAAAAQLLQPPPPAGFPQTPPSGLLTVSTSIDEEMRTPYSHTFNLTIARELPWNFSIEAAYVGRRGRKLLFIRDYAMPADLVDPASGVSAFEAARGLVGYAEQNASAPFQGFFNIGTIPYWENLFPSFGPAGINGGCLQFDIFGVVSAGNPPCGYTATQVAYDYLIGYHGTAASGSGFGVSTFWQDVDYFGFPGYMTCPTGTDIDGDGFRDCPNAFFTEQYVNLHTWGSVGRSEYHALQLTARKRMSHGLALTINYTLSKSLDHSSTPERQDLGGFFAGGYSGTAINSWEPELEYGFSDFDMRHQFNASWIWDLPFGRGQRFGSTIPAWVDQILGGWQMSGITRINSGPPAGVLNGRTWPTNWNYQGNATCAPSGAYAFGLSRGPCPSTQNVKNNSSHGGPNIFANPAQAITQFRFTEPGGRGGRNNLRADKYFVLDFALAKSFKLPWEGHKLLLRWEVFNLTNSAFFDAVYLNLDIESPGAFGDYTAVLGGPRRMQFTLRYDF